MYRSSMVCVSCSFSFSFPCITQHISKPFYQEIFLRSACSASISFSGFSFQPPAIVVVSHARIRTNKTKRSHTMSLRMGGGEKRRRSREFHCSLITYSNDGLEGTVLNILASIHERFEMIYEFRPRRDTAKKTANEKFRCFRYIVIKRFRFFLVFLSFSDFFVGYGVLLK